jgi:hypothetical protein
MAEPYVQIATEEQPRYENAPLAAPYRVSSNVVYIPTTGTTLGPGPGHLSRADELRGLRGEPHRLVQSYEPAGSMGFRGYPDFFTWLLECAGFVGTVTPGNGTSQVSTLTPSATTMTGGTWTITVDGNTTVPLPHFATWQMVKTALEGLPGAEPEDFAVSGGPLTSGAFTIRFRGTKGAKAVTLSANGAGLTGPGSPYTIAAANTTPGVNATVFDPDGVGVATGAYLWQFTKRGGATAKTLQMTFGRPDEGIYERGSGIGCSGLSLNAAGEASADLVGLVYKTIPDPGLTPVYLSSLVPPVMIGDLRLTTGLSGTGRSTDFDLNVTNPIDRFRDLSIESYFAARLEATGDPVVVTGSVTKDQLREVDVDALMRGAPFSINARWRVRHEIGTSGTFYRLYMHAPRGQYVGGDFDPMQNARRFGGRFDWFAAIDEAAGYDVRWWLVNGVAAINTYA